MAFALKPEQILLIALLAAMYVFSAVRVSRQMERLGRSRRKWLIITLLTTAIPAAVYMLHLRFRYLWTKEQPGQAEPPGAGQGDGEQAAAMVRCPRCRRLFAPMPGQESGGLSVCPRCNQAFEPEHLA